MSFHSHNKSLNTLKEELIVIQNTLIKKGLSNKRNKKIIILIAPASTKASVNKHQPEQWIDLIENNKKEQVYRQPIQQVLNTPKKPNTNQFDKFGNSQQQAQKQIYSEQKLSRRKQEEPEIFQRYHTLMESYREDLQTDNYKLAAIQNMNQDLSSYSGSVDLGSLRNTEKKQQQQQQKEKEPPQQYTSERFTHIEQFTSQQQSPIRNHSASYHSQRSDPRSHSSYGCEPISAQLYDSHQNHLQMNKIIEKSEQLKNRLQEHVRDERPSQRKQDNNKPHQSEGHQAQVIAELKSLIETLNKSHYLDLKQKDIQIYELEQKLVQQNVKSNNFEEYENKLLEKDKQIRNLQQVVLFQEFQLQQLNEFIKLKITGDDI